MWTKYWLVTCWYKLWYMVYSINNARCVHTFFLSPSFFLTIHPFTVPCSWYIYVSHYCWIVIPFQFPFFCTFSFLVTCNPPLPVNASSLSPHPVFAVYHYHVSAMYVHCHHHFLLTFFFFILLQSMPFGGPSTIILSLFFSLSLAFLSFFIDSPCSLYCMLTVQLFSMVHCYVFSF